MVPSFVTLMEPSAAVLAPAVPSELTIVVTLSVNTAFEGTVLFNAYVVALTEPSVSTYTG